MTVKECVACEKSRPLWYAGIIGVPIIVISVLYVFEIINFDNSWEWITFTILWGIGFVLVVGLLIGGIYCVKEFCKHKDDTGDDVNFDNALRLIIMLVLFCSSAILLSMIAYNIDNAYWETVNKYGTVNCDQVPSDFTPHCITPVVTPVVTDIPKYTYKNSTIVEQDKEVIWKQVEPRYYEKIILANWQKEMILDQQFLADKEWDCYDLESQVRSKTTAYDNVRPELTQMKYYKLQLKNMWEERLVDVEC